MEFLSRRKLCSGREFFLNTGKSATLIRKRRLRMKERYVLRSEVTKKAFKDLFGCDASRFEGVKVYVDSAGYGPRFASILEECGIDVSYFTKQKDGIILDA
jgi:hypothetical protein